MGTFKADPDRQGGKRHHRRAHAVRRSRTDGRRRHRPRRMVDAELQGWSRAHRQGAGGAALPDDRRHRFRRHRRAILPSRNGRPATRSSATAGAWARPISAPMPRRRASRATGWCACRDGMSARDAMAIGTAGYHRDAVGAGAGEARPDAEERPRRRDGRGRRRRLGRDRRALEARLSRHRLDRPRVGSRLSEEPRRRRGDRSQRTCRRRPSRWPRSAGPAASTASARPRSPICCR